MGNQGTLLSDVSCERAVLSTLITHDRYLEDVRDLLSLDCFTDDTLRRVYEAILSLDDKGSHIDAITLSGQLARHGVTDPMILPMLLAEAPVLQIAEYAERLHDLSRRRRLWHIGHALIASGSTEVDEVGEVITKAAERLAAISSDSVLSTTTLGESLKELTEQIVRNRTPGTPRDYSVAGFRQMDERGLLSPGSFIVVAAESSQGKTSFATAVTVNAAVSGDRIAFFSMEMTSREITARISSMYSGVNARDVLHTPLSDEQWRQYNSVLPQIPADNILFDDESTSSLSSIIGSIRAMKMRYDIKGAVVDYLQILNVNEAGSRQLNAEQTMGLAARRLKNLAKQLDIWIIALSQLSRDRNSPRPTLNRLRDSGQIVEAADTVVLIWRPSVYKMNYPEPYNNVDTDGTAMIEVAKGRNIGVFSFICGFRDEQTLFYPIAQPPSITPDNSSFNKSSPF